MANPNNPNRAPRAAADEDVARRDAPETQTQNAPETQTQNAPETQTEAAAPAPAAPAPAAKDPKAEARKGFKDRVGFKRERKRKAGFGSRTNDPVICHEPTPVIVVADGEWGENAAVRRVWNKGQMIPNFVGEAKWVRLASSGEVHDYKEKERREAEAAAAQHA